MKKYIYLLIGIILLSVTFVGCSRKEEQETPSTEPTSETSNEELKEFEANVLESEKGLLVTPKEGSSELSSADKIFVHILDIEKDNIDTSKFKPGDILKITYDGLIAESYPAQITASKIELIGHTTPEEVSEEHESSSEATKESETSEELETSVESETTEKPETTEETTKKAETTKAPESTEAPSKKPDPTTEAKSDKHTIYIGEQLKIPVSSETTTKTSTVIKSGTISSSQKQIALTFDAGWLYDQTTDLLDVLDEYGVKSTFFLRGKWVEDHPDLAKEIHNRGHSVENHSLTHGHLKDMSDSEVRNEISSTTRAIERITGYKPYLFRPPYGEYNNTMLSILGEQGYTHTVMWTLDSLDWLEEYKGDKVTAQFLTNRVLTNATDKGIILMHVGGYETVNALPAIIEGLTSDGYKLRKVNDMVPKTSGTSGVTNYTVKKGDTLYSISRQFGLSVDDILAANPNR